MIANTQSQRFKKALQLATEALDLVREFPEMGSKGNIYIIYSQALSLNGKSELANSYFDSALTFKTTELKSTFDKGITEMQTKYETVEKEKEIIKKNSEIKQRKAQAYLLYGGLAAFALIAGLSYRTSFDGAQYRQGSSVSKQKLQYFTPIVGVNFENFMFAYTYSQLSGAVKFDNGGYHQITLGIDLFCKPVKYDCNCPAIN